MMIRRAKIIARVFEDGATELSIARLCEVCIEITGTTGAGVMLMSGDVAYGSLCTTNDVSARIEDLQFTLGEGPCIDTYEQERSILEPDLALTRSPRWLAFSASALDAGVMALFAIPIRMGAVRLGALNLYRDQKGPLSEEQHSNALVIADLIAQTVLDMQAKAPAGTMAAGLEANANFQPLVNQAAGMVAVQLGTSVFKALVRLRADAFVKGCLVRDVAEEVVTRRLRFSDPESSY